MKKELNLEENQKLSMTACYSQSFILSALKHLEMPKYFTPKKVIEKIQIETILGNPKWS